MSIEDVNQCLDYSVTQSRYLHTHHSIRGQIPTLPIADPATRGGGIILLSSIFALKANSTYNSSRQQSYEIWLVRYPNTARPDPN